MESSTLCSMDELDVKASELKKKIVEWNKMFKVEFDEI